MTKEQIKHMNGMLAFSKIEGRAQPILSFLAHEAYIVINRGRPCRLCPFESARNSGTGITPEEIAGKQNLFMALFSEITAAKRKQKKLEAEAKERRK